MKDARVISIVEILNETYAAGRADNSYTDLVIAFPSKLVSGVPFGKIPLVGRKRTCPPTETESDFATPPPALQSASQPVTPVTPPPLLVNPGKSNSGEKKKSESRPKKRSYIDEESEDSEVEINTNARENPNSGGRKTGREIVEQEESEVEPFSESGNEEIPTMLGNVPPVADKEPAVAGKDPPAAGTETPVGNGNAFLLRMCNDTIN